MYNKDKAKQTLYWLVLAIMIVIFFLPVFAAAKHEDEPQLIINYEALRKPKDEPVPSPSPTPSPQISPKKATEAPKQIPANGQSYTGRKYTTTEVIELIKQYSQQLGIQPDAPLCIAKLESGYNQFSKNKNSSASGVFQYLSGTWKATDEGRAGLSVWDAESNIKAALKYMASRKNAKPWTVAKSCPPVKSL